MVFSGGTVFLKTILNLQLRTLVSLRKLFFSDVQAYKTQHNLIFIYIKMAKLYL